MKTNTIIELTEEDVNAAIRIYIKEKLAPNQVPSKIRYYTDVRGDYDKGTAKEFVKLVVVEINEL
jgi:hypothetical protein